MLRLFSWLVLIVCLSSLTAGCQKSTVERPDDPAEAAPNALAPEMCWRSKKGKLLYDGLDGGAWRFETYISYCVPKGEGTLANILELKTVELRSAHGCPPLETMIKNASLKPGMTVIAIGRWADGEPLCFEVRDIVKANH